MDPEQTFIRVQERFAQMLTPRIRATLEYFYLFMAVTLFCILVVMHANYVQQPGCSSELSRVNISDAQLIQIKITSAGLWSQNQTNYDVVNLANEEPISENLKHANEDSSVTAATKPWLDWLSDGAKSGKSLLYSNSESSESSLGSSTNSESVGDDVVPKISKEVSLARFFISPKESLKAAIIRIGQKWHGRLSFIWRVSKRVLGGLWDIAGIHLHIDIPKLLKTLHLDKLNSYAGLFISSYLWCTISLNVGSGYDQFDKKEVKIGKKRWTASRREKNRPLFEEERNPNSAREENSLQKAAIALMPCRI